MKPAAFLLALALSSPAVAQEKAAPKALDPASAEALKKTQEMLNSPAMRNQALQGDANAQKWDTNAKNLTGGGQNQEELYRITSQVLTHMVQQNGGDAQKILMQLEAAKGNPEAFFNSLPQAQQEEIRKLAGRVPAGQAAGPAVPK